MVSATDEETLIAFEILSKLEGIIPALESAHAIHYALEEAKRKAKERKENLIVVNLSGRGDKDIFLVEKVLGGECK